MATSAAEWDQLTDVERTCLGTAFARWHASSGGSLVRKWPDGTPWYTDPLGPILVQGIPPERQEEMAARRLQGDAWMLDFMAVRTTELDHQIGAAVKEGGDSTRQLVLIGAGMDTRAWRLSWPPGFSVFEVDSPQVLGFKNRRLQQGDGSAATQQQQQQQEEGGVPPLSCQRRTTVPADASQAAELWQRLTAAGLDASRPVVYVMEGFIGYLTVEASNTLLRLLATNSAPGSRIILTCPPGPEVQHRSAAALAAAAAEGGKPPEPAAVRDSDGSAHQADGAAAAAVSVSAATHQPMKLHHSTFEEATVTRDRVAAAGWSGCRLLTADELAAKYSVERAQPIVLGHKE